MVGVTEEIIHFEKIKDPPMKRDMLPQSIREKYAPEGMKKRKEKDSRKQLNEIVEETTQKQNKWKEAYTGAATKVTSLLERQTSRYIQDAEVRKAKADGKRTGKAAKSSGNRGTDGSKVVQEHGESKGKLGGDNNKRFKLGYSL